MIKPGRHPTSAYLLRRLRSYEEVRADRQADQDRPESDGEQNPRQPRDQDSQADGDLCDSAKSRKVPSPST